MKVTKKQASDILACFYAFEKRSNTVINSSIASSPLPSLIAPETQ